MLSTLSNANEALEGPMPVWKQNPDLMIRLTEAQNHPCFEHQDILTFAAFCDTRAELERHVVACEDRAARYVAPVRRRRRAA
jgi:hypothetical protein